MKHQYIRRNRKHTQSRPGYQPGSGRQPGSGKWYLLVLFVLILAAGAIIASAAGRRTDEDPPDPASNLIPPASSKGFTVDAPDPASTDSETVTRYARLDVPFIDQRDSWPTGCESVAAAMVLQYWGADITVDQFIDEYLPMADAPATGEDGVFVGADPRQYFLGDPRSGGGWGCYAPVIVTALNSALQAGRYGDTAGYAAIEPQGLTLADLCEEYVQQGVPVLVWASINMEPLFADELMYIAGTGEYFQWYYPMHCLVLVGQDDRYYYFNDPNSGKNAAYSKSTAEDRYKAMGMQAVAVVPKS